MTHWILKYILTFNLSVVSLLLYADKHLPGVPDFIPGVKTLTAESVINLVQSMDEAILIDSRIYEDRSMGYIEDSVSLSDLDTNCTSLNNIATSIKTPLIFYCNGIRCGRSVTAVKVAQECGYEKLFWFKGGFEEWKVKDYPYLLD